MNIETSDFMCPVCGFPSLEEEPYPSRRQCSYEICPSCGFQFGYDDMDRGITFAEWRKEWVTEGMKWSSSNEDSRPSDWNAQKQLQGLSSFGPRSRRRLGFCISYEFLKQNVCVSWRYIYFGLTHECIVSDIAKQYCEEIIKADDSHAEELSIISATSDDNEILSCVKALGEMEMFSYTQNELVHKWLFVILLWVYEHRHLYDDPLMAAQIICDDFGCPGDVASFVWHMYPQNVDNEASKARDVQLMANWRKYIEKGMCVWKRRK